MSRNPKGPCAQPPAASVLLAFLNSNHLAPDLRSVDMIAEPAAPTSWVAVGRALLPTRHGVRPPPRQQQQQQ